MSKLSNNSLGERNARMFVPSPQGYHNPTIFNHLKRITNSDPEKEYSSFFGFRDNPKQVSKPTLQLLASSKRGVSDGPKKGAKTPYPELPPVYVNSPLISQRKSVFKTSSQLGINMKDDPSPTSVDTPTISKHKKFPASKIVSRAKELQARGTQL